MSSYTGDHRRSPCLHTQVRDGPSPRPAFIVGRAPQFLHRDHTYGFDQQLVETEESSTTSQRRHYPVSESTVSSNHSRVFGSAAAVIRNSHLAEKQLDSVLSKWLRGGGFQL